jgi:hypothetical protein
MPSFPFISSRSFPSSPNLPAHWQLTGRQGTPPHFLSPRAFAILLTHRIRLTIHAELAIPRPQESRALDESTMEPESAMESMESMPEQTEPLSGREAAARVRPTLPGPCPSLF